MFQKLTVFVDIEFTWDGKVMVNSGIRARVRQSNAEGSCFGVNLCTRRFVHCPFKVRNMVIAQLKGKTRTVVFEFDEKVLSRFPLLKIEKQEFQLC